MSNRAPYFVFDADTGIGQRYATEAEARRKAQEMAEQGRALVRVVVEIAQYRGDKVAES